MGKNLRKVSRSAWLSQKKGFIFGDQIWHYEDLNQYSMAQKIQFTLLTDFKINLQKTAIYGESFWEVLKFALLSQKNGFDFVEQVLHFKAF